MGDNFARKFQIKEGHRVGLIEAPAEVADEIGSRLSRAVVVAPEPEACDVVLLFARSMADLDLALPQAAAAMAPAGTLWIARLKKASRITTDVEEPAVRLRGRAAGLADIMVRSVHPDWSALKFRRQG